MTVGDHCTWIAIPSDELTARNPQARLLYFTIYYEHMAGIVADADAVTIVVVEMHSSQGEVVRRRG